MRFVGLVAARDCDGGGCNGPLLCNITLLQLMLQFMQLRLQLGMRLGHGVQRRAGGGWMKRMCAETIRYMPELRMDGAYTASVELRDDGWAREV